MPSILPRVIPIAFAALMISIDGVSAQKKGSASTTGELMMLNIPARYYVYGSIDTEFKSMGEPVGKTVASLIKTAGDNKLPLVGPVLHVYHGAPHTAPDKSFKMETGFLVQKGSKIPGEFKLRELPKFKCASMLYVGPGLRIGDAWQKLYKAIGDKGLTPTMEERELYLYFEANDSPNNVVQVMIGIK